MDKTSTISYFIYLAIMALSTYLVRAVPFVLFKEKIKNEFIQSFLYYIPYSVLGCLTFPVIFYSAGNPAASITAALFAVLLAYRGKSMFFTAVCSSLLALAVNCIIIIL